MHIIINNSSMVPIYEQIVDQIKAAIIDGTLEKESMLPSVRGLSNELKISALTVKKAYDYLEEEKYVVTVHGKGTFVSAVNPDLLKESQEREIQNELCFVIDKALKCGMNKQDLKELFEVLLEEEIYD